MHERAERHRRGLRHAGELVPKKGSSGALQRSQRARRRVGRRGEQELEDLPAEIIRESFEWERRFDDVERIRASLLLAHNLWLVRAIE